MIMCDVDETIVSTASPPWAPKEAIHISGEYSSIARPGAHEFLRTLKQMGPLYVFTSGQKEFQTKVLTKLGLIEFFDGMYASDDIKRLSERNWELSVKKQPLVEMNAILIDDLKPNTVGFIKKSLALGILRDPSEWYVNVPPYLGKPTDNALAVALNQVRRLIKT